MKNSRGLFVADGSISNFVMTEWTPEGQAGQTPKSLGLRIITRLLKKSFYSGCSKMPRYEAPEILRSEAYLDVRRNDEG